MIKVERHTDRVLEELDVFNWPVWEKEVSEFPWVYDMEEVCYILSGEATITPDSGDSVTICKGDFVTFPCEMKCMWKITIPIRKHFNFR